MDDSGQLHGNLSGGQQGTAKGNARGLVDGVRLPFGVPALPRAQWEALTAIEQGPIVEIVLDGSIPIVAEDGLKDAGAGLVREQPQQLDGGPGVGPAPGAKAGPAMSKGLEPLVGSPPETRASRGAS